MKEGRYEGIYSHTLAPSLPHTLSQYPVPSTGSGVPPPPIGGRSVGDSSPLPVEVLQLKTQILDFSKKSGILQAAYDVEFGCFAYCCSN
ncbi:hypothetical protein [Chlorogloeopsis fritschii]|uniref:hypothetical protein n=1 Tax=Chlorogloeopsis fritschii TaxID=1124 RepID=UPI0023F565E4|nr:hypothetical protein [Chlorogloeopsis fritschii]